LELSPNTHRVGSICRSRTEGRFCSLDERCDGKGQATEAINGRQHAAPRDHRLGRGAALDQAPHRERLRLRRPFVLGLGLAANLGSAVGQSAILDGDCVEIRGLILPIIVIGRAEAGIVTRSRLSTRVRFLSTTP
jgi:hypothetical protein